MAGMNRGMSLVLIVISFLGQIDRDDYTPEFDSRGRLVHALKRRGREATRDKRPLSDSPFQLYRAAIRSVKGSRTTPFAPRLRHAFCYTPPRVGARPLPATARAIPPSNSRELTDGVPLQARERMVDSSDNARLSGRSK